MNLLIVVPVHNPNEVCLKNIINLIEKFPNEQILIIDNNSTQIECLDKIKKLNCLVEKNQFGPTYEPGALLHAFVNYNYDNYLLIQDSIKLVDTMEIELFLKQNICDVLALDLFFPAFHQIKKDQINYIKNNFKNISYGLFINPGIHWSSFIIKREVIQNIIDINVLKKEKLPKNKSENESWERIFGLAFGYIKKNIKSFGFIYDAIYNLSLPKNIIFKLNDNKKFEKKYLSRL